LEDLNENINVILEEDFPEDPNHMKRDVSKIIEQKTK